MNLEASPSPTYSKGLEYAKQSPQNDVYINSTTAHSIHKNPSCTTFQTDHFKSNSFFSSFLFSERGKKAISKLHIPTPQINIQSIIKKKADMYYDPQMAENVDELLESGYTMVLDRKNQKKSLKAEEEELRENIAQVERDILPIMNRYFVLKDDVANHRAQQVVFIEQAEKVHKDIEKMSESIEVRKAEIEKMNQDYQKRISSVKEKIEDIKGSTINNREVHRQEIVDLKREIMQNKEEKLTLNQELTSLKAKYENLKKNHGDKQRKIENKSRMFLGLLKH